MTENGVKGFENIDMSFSLDSLVADYVNLFNEIMPFNRKDYKDRPGYEIPQRDWQK